MVIKHLWMMVLVRFRVPVIVRVRVTGTVMVTVTVRMWFSIGNLDAVPTITTVMTAGRSINMTSVTEAHPHSRAVLQVFADDTGHVLSAFWLTRNDPRVGAVRREQAVIYRKKAENPD